MAYFSDILSALAVTASEEQDVSVDFAMSLWLPLPTDFDGHRDGRNDN
jgi:hypothetical protein